MAAESPASVATETLVIFNPSMFANSSAVARDPVAIVRGMLKMFSNCIFLGFENGPIAACSEAKVPYIPHETRACVVHPHDDFVFLQLPHRHGDHDWQPGQETKVAETFRTSVASIGYKAAIPVTLAPYHTVEDSRLPREIRPSIMIAERFVEINLPTHTLSYASEDVQRTKKSSIMRVRWKYNNIALCISYVPRGLADSSEPLLFQFYSYHDHPGWTWDSRCIEMHCAKKPVVDYGRVAEHAGLWIHDATGITQYARRAGKVEEGCHPPSPKRIATDEAPMVKEQKGETVPSRYGKCLVCMDKEADMVYLHCCHLAVCEACMEKSADLKRTCPYCREHSNSVMKIYNVGCTDDRNSEIKTEAGAATTPPPANT